MPQDLLQAGPLGELSAHALIQVQQARLAEGLEHLRATEQRNVQQAISLCATDNIYHATFDVQQSLCRVQHTHAELAQHASAHLRYKTWRCRRASSRTRRARARA
jgi:hypothetical protein